LGTDHKNRHFKKRKEAVERSFGMGRPENQKCIKGSTPDMERHFRQTLERATSPLFKIMIMVLAVCILMMFFVMAAMGAEKCYLTPNFSTHEFTRKCDDTLPTALKPNLNELTKNLQIIRNHIHKPVIVISGYRSSRCNLRVRGAQKSQHMHAKAADIVVKNMSHDDLHRLILKLIKEGKIREGGVGLYRTHVHYDIRGYRSRWYKASDEFINVLGGYSDEGG
jgi:uncharacterized protein YcbK (DUF882 family)